MAGIINYVVDIRAWVSKVVLKFLEIFFCKNHLLRLSRFITILWVSITIPCIWIWIWFKNLLISWTIDWVSPPRSNSVLLKVAFPGLFCLDLAHVVPKSNFPGIFIDLAIVIVTPPCERNANFCPHILVVNSNLFGNILNVQSWIFFWTNFLFVLTKFSKSQFLISFVCKSQNN